jgi:hypothetical protein
MAYFGGFHPEPNKSGDTRLAFTGFSDWKNAIARLRKHESSKIHSDCDQQRLNHVIIPHIHKEK